LAFSVQRSAFGGSSNLDCSQNLESSPRPFSFSIKPGLPPEQLSERLNVSLEWFLLLFSVLLHLPFMDDFTQFDAFERCREFARGVGRHLSCGALYKDPVLTAALRKTLLSVYSNFGEGFERDGNREFAQFLSIAKGSIGETRAQLIYALDFGYLTPETFCELDELAKTATACLGGLIRYLNNSSFRGRKFKQREDFPNEPKPPPKAPNAER
jgi:four helix bundle protein